MSLSLPEQDTDDPATQPSLDSARQAHPLKDLLTALELMRQLVVIWIRKAFSLPSDLTRQAQIDAGLSSLYTNQQNFLGSLNELIAAHNQLQERLSYYEQHVPRIRDLKQYYLQEKAGLRAKTSNGSDRIQLLG